MKYCNSRLSSIPCNSSRRLSLLNFRAGKWLSFKNLITICCSLVLRNPLADSIVNKACISCIATLGLLDKYKIGTIWEMITLYACLTGLFDWNFMNCENLNSNSRLLSNFCMMNMPIFSSITVIRTFVKCASIPDWGKQSENWETSVLISIMSDG